MTRRGFLMGSCAFLVLASMPGVANAAPSRTIVLEAVKDATTGRYNTVKVPSGIASEIGLHRAQELERASNRALSIAQSQNIARPKANGLLTRIWKPALKGSPKGIVPSLLQAGLVLAFTWALSNATAELTNTNSTLNFTPSANCANLPTAPSSVWNQSTGVYRSTNGSSGVAVQRTTGQSSGGTVSPPAGWSTAAQRNAVSNGNGFDWEVVFSKNVACGERVAFPPTVPNGAIPGPEHVGNQTDTNSAANRTKIVDAQNGAAVADQKAGATVPGGEVPGEVEDGAQVPENPSPAPAGPAETPYKPGDYTDPRTQIGNDDVHVKFPAEVDLAAPTTPGTGTPTPSPTPTPTPSSGVPADEDTTPGTVDELPGFDSFANPFKNLFKPFTEALTPTSASCPSLQMPAVTVYNGKGLAATSFNYHCQLIGPFEGIIRTVSIAYGGWVGVKNAMDA